MSLKTLVEEFDITNYNNIENIKLINNFITIYNIIEDEDNKKPVFSTTYKYNAYKSRNKEYKKKKKKNVWKKIKPENEIKKIELKIRSNLNKMNDDVYNDILLNLKKNLLEIDDICILNYFINILYEKIIFDKKFQKKYLDMLDELSNYNLIYNNYIEYKNKKNKFYWNLINNPEIHGPFKNKELAFKSIKNELNLNSLFLNILHKEFKKMYDYIDEMEKETEDEAKYKLKRKYIGVFEILTILYNNNKIPIHILIISIKKLLEFKNINYDIECLHIITQKINMKDINKDVLNDIKVIFEKVDISKLPSRIKFLSYDICDSLNE
jgi:hypothetical protein